MKNKEKPTYPIHDKVCQDLHDSAYPESNICCDGTLSAVCAILCHNDIPHSFTITAASELDLVSLWFEENEKEFHVEWYEEKSMKHLEEED